MKLPTLGITALFILVSTPVSSQLVSSVLPSGRSVRVGTPATAFASVINVGTETATACSISPVTDVPGVFLYQTTDPTTNALTGTTGTPADIGPNGLQTYMFAFTPTAPFPPTQIELRFDCTNTEPAEIVPGLNTFSLMASETPVPDILALAATQSNDGVLHIPPRRVQVPLRLRRSISGLRHPSEWWLIPRGWSCLWSFRSARRILRRVFASIP